jgi:hypothetical protein
MDRITRELAEVREELGEGVWDREGERLLERRGQTWSEERGRER